MPVAVGLGPAEGSPVIHEQSAFLEQIAPKVGCFGLVFERMS